MSELNSIDVSSISTKILLDVMARIVTELQRRDSTPDFTPSVEPAAPVFSPTKQEVVFIKNCLSANTVKATMKDTWRELYEKYSEWFEHNGYPSSLRGATFKEWKIYHSPRSK